MLMKNESLDQSEIRCTSQFAHGTKAVHVIDDSAALVRQRDEWKREVQLIAGEWAKDVRQNIDWRPIVVHRIFWPDRQRRYVLVAIDGTPCRGQIIVPHSKFEPVIRFSQTVRRFSESDQRLLRCFANNLCELAWPREASIG